MALQQQRDRQGELGGVQQENGFARSSDGSLLHKRVLLHLLGDADVTGYRVHMRVWRVCPLQLPSCTQCRQAPESAAHS